MAYNETMLGGLKLAGVSSAVFVLPTGSGCGGCNVFSESMEGGVSLSGIAAESSTALTIRGGLRCAGSAIVNTWNDVYIWLLQESATGATGEMVELMHGLNGTAGNGSMFLPTRDDGLFCLYCQEFDGAGSYISLPVDSIATDQGFCVTFWGRIDAFYEQRIFFSRGDMALGTSVLNHFMASMQTLDTLGTATDWVAFSDETYAEGNWYLFSASWTPGVGLILYVNGVEVGSEDTTDTLPASSGSYIARWNNGGSITGAMQDVRLYGEPKGSAWLTAQRDNYCDPSFYAVYPSDSALG